MRALGRRLAATLRRLISQPGGALETDDTVFEGEASEPEPNSWGQIEPMAPLPAEEAPEPGAKTRVSVNFLIQTLSPLDGRFGPQ